MRNSIVSLVLVSTVSTLFGLAGCGAPTDDTQNRMAETPIDPGYPTGPYGYVEGATVADYKFLGKTPADGNYDALPMRQLLLGEFHTDPGMKLLLVEGSANWCYFCNQEASEIEGLSVDHAGEGFRALTVLAEGSVRGLPAEEGDLSDWVNTHAFKKTSMAIDPEGRLFMYAPASAFPVHILLNTQSMKIEWLCVGGIGGCDTKGAVVDTLSRL